MCWSAGTRQLESRYQGDLTRFRECGKIVMLSNSTSSPGGRRAEPTATQLYNLCRAQARCKQTYLMSDLKLHLSLVRQFTTKYRPCASSILTNIAQWQSNKLITCRLQVRILSRVFGKFRGGHLLGSVSVTIFSERSVGNSIGGNLTAPSCVYTNCVYNSSSEPPSR